MRYFHLARRRRLSTGARAACDTRYRCRAFSWASNIIIGTNYIIINNTYNNIM